MSLTAQQEEDTRRELRENFEKSGLTVEEIAESLDASVDYMQELFALRPRRYEDTWILRNLLIRAVQEQGETPVPFTALAGDWHKIWFLDGDFIDNGRIGR